MMFFVRKFNSIFGVMTLDWQLSMKDRLLIKKVHGGVQVESRLDYAQDPLHHDHIKS
jgi:hypothetical protein